MRQDQKYTAVTMLFLVGHLCVLCVAPYPTHSLGCEKGRLHILHSASQENTFLQTRQCHDCMTSKRHKRRTTIGSGEKHTATWGRASLGYNGTQLCHGCSSDYFGIIFPTETTYLEPCMILPEHLIPVHLHPLRAHHMCIRAVLGW